MHRVLFGYTHFSMKVDRCQVTLNISQFDLWEIWSRIELKLWRKVTDMPNQIYYFAYGSNMNPEQMENRCPRNHKLLRKGTLEGWEFFINSRGVANIIMSENTNVYGLIFEISDRCLNCLDMHEGYPRIYQRDDLPIKFKRESLNAWVYIDKNFIQVGRPRTNYLEPIIDAAIKFNFPGAYITHLQKFL